MDRATTAPSPLSIIAPTIAPSTPYPPSPLPSPAAEVIAEAEIVELTPDTFDAFLVAEGPGTMVMIDFYTVQSPELILASCHPNHLSWSNGPFSPQDTCGPCKLMFEHYKKLPAVFKKVSSIERQKP